MHQIWPFFRIWPESRFPHRWSRERGLRERNCVEVGRFLTRVHDLLYVLYIHDVNGHSCFIPKSCRWVVVFLRFRPYVSAYHKLTTILLRAIMHSPVVTYRPIGKGNIQTVYVVTNRSCTTNLGFGCRYLFNCACSYVTSSTNNAMSFFFSLT